MLFFNLANVIIETTILWLYCNSLYNEKNNCAVKKWLTYIGIVLLTFFTGNMHLSLYFNLTVAFSVCFLASYIIYEGNFKNKLFMSVMYIVISVFTDVIVTVIISTSGIQYNIAGEDNITYIVGAMISNFVRLWLCAYVGRIFGKKLYGFSFSYWLFFILCPLLSILCLLIFDGYLMQAEQINLITVFIPSLCILYVNFMLFRFFETFSEKIRLKVVEEVAEKEKENYRILENNEIELRILRHDIKNHILMIQEYLKDENNETAIKHLKEINQTLENLSSVVYTANPSIDAALNIGSRKAVANDIDYKVQILGLAEIKINEADICKLLSNAIDNAIEASQIANDKYIYIEIKQIDDKIKIHIENSTKDNYLNLISRKPDKKQHGFGLKSIKKTVEKYKGEINYCVNDNIFNLDIILINDVV